MSTAPNQPTTQPAAPGVQPELIELVQAHTELLYRYAYRLSGSASDAEDLVQQTYVLALQNLTQLRDRTAAKAWLCALLRSAFGRLVRQPRVTCVSLSELCEIELIEPIETTNLDIDSAELQAALNRLPEDYRLVLLGYYFEDCSYQELATRLAIPLGTVMSRLSRAKRWLREQLSPQEVVPLK